MLVLLTRDAEPSVLVAYLASKHPALTPLLPQDTQPVDLFNIFFDMEEAEDAAAPRKRWLQGGAWLGPCHRIGDAKLSEACKGGDGGHALKKPHEA